jgi:hypothetical protein
MERASHGRSLPAGPGQARDHWPTANILKGSNNFRQLAIQLWLDPETAWLEFVEALPVPEAGMDVQVKMLVADRPEGRVAFDIIDERRPHDADHEGLLLLGLEHRSRQITQVDNESINREPMATNSARIWHHRGRWIEQDVVSAIDRVLAGHQQISIRKLGRLIGLSEPLAIVSALISQGMIDTDLSIKFGLSSLVFRRWGPDSSFTSHSRSAVRFFARKP